MKLINLYLLIFLSLIVVFLTEYLLKTNKIFFDFLTENYTKKEVLKVYALREKWDWISYAIIPLLLLIKTTLIASVIYIGTFFHIKIKVTFKQLFNEVVKAEFIFLGVSVLKIVWFYFFQTSYTLEDLQYFYPLSALNIVGYQGLEPWFIYPLQTLNLFELMYWLLLAYYIGKMASPTKNKEKNKYPIDFGLKIVASSYGVALLLWVVVVMFFTLNYS